MIKSERTSHRTLEAPPAKGVREYEDSTAMEEMTRAAQTRQKLSPEDRSFVSWLHMACGGDGKLMEGRMAANLNSMQWLSR